MMNGDIISMAHGIYWTDTLIHNHHDISRLSPVILDFGLHLIPEGQVPDLEKQLWQVS